MDFAVRCPLVRYGRLLFGFCPSGIGPVTATAIIAAIAQPHVITTDILRFLNMSLKEANWTLNLRC